MKKFSLLLLTSLVLTNGAWAAENQLPVTRFGLFVGANQGGDGRAPLQYAVTDAETVRDVMTELGGIASQNYILLKNPQPSDVLASLGSLRGKMNQAKAESRRVEIMFYYSGHSDEEGLLFADKRLGYKEIRDALQLLPADIRIAILDSCSSGAFARTKGGKMKPPFLIDESSKMTGHAYLTSSSENEASQESDKIGGSYFTHYLVSGLRGGADATGDGKFTLNELYHHAFQNTLEKTESTQAGPQHPSYDIQLTGSGDLVMTDIQNFSSKLRFEDQLSGRIFVRTGSGFLAAEVEKGAGPLVLALPEGRYSVQVVQADGLGKAEVILAHATETVLGAKDLTAGRLERNRLRGGTLVESPLAEDHGLSLGDASLSLVPGLDLTLGKPDDKKSFQVNALVGGAKAINGLQVSGIIGTVDQDLVGMQFAGIGSTVFGRFDGIQGSGIFNVVNSASRGMQYAAIFSKVNAKFDGIQASGIFNQAGDLKGFQAAAIFNTSGDLAGFQAAGVFNLAQKIDGFQVSLVNIAGKGRGFQAGLVNISDSTEIFGLGLININPLSYLHVRYFLDQSQDSAMDIQWGWGPVYLYYLHRVNHNNVELVDHALGLGFRSSWDNVFLELDGGVGQYQVSYTASWAASDNILADSSVINLRILTGVKAGPFAFTAGVFSVVDPWERTKPAFGETNEYLVRFKLDGLPLLLKNRFFVGVQL